MACSFSFILRAMQYGSVEIEGTHQRGIRKERSAVLHSALLKGQFPTLKYEAF